MIIWWIVIGIVSSNNLAKPSHNHYFYLLKIQAMRVLLEVKDEKAVFFMELIKNFSFVKSKPVNKKENFLTELQGAVDQVNLAKKRKIKLKSAEELLNEL
jgi:hypothetical protein